MTIPHLIRLERERDAKLCRELAEKALRSPTLENLESAEHSTRWFEKKHKTGWRKFVGQEIER